MKKNILRLIALSALITFNSPVFSASQPKDPGFFESLDLIKTGMRGVCAGPYNYLFGAFTLVNSIYMLGNMEKKSPTQGFWASLGKNLVKGTTVAASLCSAYTSLNRNQSNISPAVASFAAIIAAAGMIYSASNIEINEKFSPIATMSTSIFVAPMAITSIVSLFS